MTDADVRESTHRAVLLDAGDPEQAQEIARLRTDVGIEFIDRISEDDRDEIGRAHV